MQLRSNLGDSGHRWIAGLVLMVTLAGSGHVSSAHAASAFGFEQVIAQAQALSKKPYEKPKAVHAAAATIERNTWSSIDFRNDAALWHGPESSFEVQFFHAGSFYETAVALNEINANSVRPIAFSKDGFVYPKQGMREALPNNIGYAGFRLHYPVNEPGKMDEVAVFLGASYFRALGKGQAYGLSGRGVAINTAMDDDEEFPAFREFWLEKPGPNAKQIKLYALLDGKHITGAYEFVIRPGEATVMRVKSRLFPRKEIEKLGLGALTSMFMFGENSLSKLRDWRPEMHDSDGMLVVDGGGEWLWRPLVNPSELASNSLYMNNPRGFGLIQKDRDFDHYHDLFDNYERRPNAWVTPSGDWGRGHVELVQIPSDSEQNDNIVAFWVPEQKIKRGQELSYDYEISWNLERPVPPTTAQVLHTLVGEIPPHEEAPDRARRLAVDFAGGPLEKAGEDISVYAKITVGQGDEKGDNPEGKLMASKVQPNPHTGGWRLEFDVLPDDDDDVLELRAYLADKQGKPLTETWSYALNQ